MVRGYAVNAIPLEGTAAMNGWGAPAGCTALVASRTVAQGEADKWRGRIGKKVLGITAYPNAQEKYDNQARVVANLDAQMAAAGCSNEGAVGGSTFAVLAPILGVGVALGAGYLYMRRRR